MKRQDPTIIRPSDITPREVFLQRRSLLASLASTAALGSAWPEPAIATATPAPAVTPPAPPRFTRNTQYRVSDPPPNSFHMAATLGGAKR